MSNKGDIVILVPGVSGWEIWEGTPGSGFERKELTTAHQAGGIPSLPALDVMYFFAVKNATVMPFKTTTADESLFEDLAQMHSERMGIRTDPGAGQLIDHFVMEKGEEMAVLTTVVLRAPEEGELPSRSPKEFDYSPRAYAFEGDGIAFWKEFGQWVFAFYHQGQMLYAQSTSNDAEHPDAALLRDVRLALVQLSFQGITFVPRNVRVWHPDGELGEAGALRDAFEARVVVTKRPDPAVPVSACKLLPADVYAQRREAAKRRQVISVAGAAVALVLGFVGYAGWTLWQEIRATNTVKLAAKAMQPERDAFNEHKEKWRELGPLVDEDQWPVETLYRITRCMPQPKGIIRLREANINNNEIRIKGESSQAPPIGQFSFAINKSEELTRFKFTAPPPNNTSKGWEFVIQGAVPQEQQ
ncbi:MAG: hypothetical protein ACOVRB_02585 [Akkermansiaceae bacterium]